MRDSPETFLLTQRARSTVNTAVVQGTVVLIQFLLTVLLAHALGAHDYGVYAFAIAVVTILQSPAQASIGNVGLRLTAAYLEREDWGRLRGLWRWSIGWLLRYACIAGGILGASVAYLSSPSTDKLTLYFSIFLLFLIPVSSFLGAALRGANYTVLGQLPEFIVRPGVTLILTGIATLWLGADFIGPEHVMELHIVAACLAVLLGWRWLAHNAPASAFSVTPIYERTIWRRAALSLSLMAVMAVINNQTDILMLGWLATPDDVGLYRVAMQGSTLVGFALTASNLVIAPEISRLYTRSDQHALQRLVTWSARVTLFGAVPVAVVFWFFGRPILANVFGSEFVGAYSPLTILAIGQVVNVGMGSVGTVLNMTGYERESAIGSAVGALVNLTLNIALIPTYGTVGAAISSAISMTSWNAVQAWYVYRRLGLRTTALGVKSRRRQAVMKPNFFILGAPKCGTTSLAAWLAEHPSIFFSPVKEPCYFNSDFKFPGRLSPNEYENLFAKATNSHLRVGEGSTDYLRSKVAVANILKYSPDAKFIVCVRNPIEMVVSLHRQRLREARENQAQFDVAWHLQESRSNGTAVPMLCSDPQDLQYGPACKLGEQLERLYEQVPRARVLVLFLDDLRANPAREYQRVLKFLDLPDDNRSEFPVHNESRVVNHALATLVRSLVLAKLALRFRGGLGVMQRLESIFSQSFPTTRTSAENRTELAAYFQSDIEKLGQIVGRDLTPWLNRPTRDIGASNANPGLYAS